MVMIEEPLEVRRLCDIHMAGNCTVVTRRVVFIMRLKGWFVGCHHQVEWIHHQGYPQCLPDSCKYGHGLKKWVFYLLRLSRKA
jgi:hypothetical protein